MLFTLVLTGGAMPETAVPSDEDSFCFDEPTPKESLFITVTSKCKGADIGENGS